MKVRINKFVSTGAVGLMMVAASGCNSSSTATAAETAPAATTTAPVTGDPATATPVQRTYAKDALILSLSGLSDVDAYSIASILKKSGRTYDIVSSSELDKMSVEDLAKYGMIAVGGGYGGQASRSLEPDTRERVRKAVTEKGVNYVGFCAGAFMAVSPAGANGGAPDYGFSIVPAAKLLDYFYPFNDGNDETAAAIPVSFSDGTKREILFWGGPALPEVPNGVIARYADGTPAAIQTRSGSGFITLVGPHPEGPSDWKAVAGVTDPDGDDFDIAAKLFESTLTQQPIKGF